MTLKVERVNRLLNFVDKATKRVKWGAGWSVFFLSILILFLALWWAFYFIIYHHGSIVWFPDANNLEVFAGIIGFLVGGLTLWTATKAENATEIIQNFLARSWAGIQTDYGAGLEKSSDPLPEIERHIEDLKRGICVPRTTPLDNVHFMLSSFAYGIEHSPKQLSRFIDVLEYVLTHPSKGADVARRPVTIAIWPLLEHQAIWGANRRGLPDKWKASGRQNQLSPALRELAAGNSHAAQEWAKARPNWCSEISRTWDTIVQLKRFCKLIDYCKEHDNLVHLEIQEIDQWPGRAFFCKYGSNEYFTLLIATTPINSTTLLSQHWTSIGFSTSTATSYSHLCRVYDTCVTARHSYHDLTMSRPLTESEMEKKNDDDIVHKTAKFFSEPYMTVGDYFCLPPGWQTWRVKSDAAFIGFYSLISACVENDKQPAAQVLAQPEAQLHAKSRANTKASPSPEKRKGG